jgi:acetylornithine/succinyldiaminopimelate/putrescine aminotransferase
VNTAELKNAIIYDRKAHPERTNATFERISEVAENVLGNPASQLLADLRAELGDIDDRDELTEQQADKIIEVIIQAKLVPEKLQSIRDQLMYSEIATQEAIDIHEEFKIPVSHLEKDIVPVLGKGCWIMDSKGDSYLDMDSNYSATNLGMSNDEIAQGLYNQATTLISMKEDRVQIARTRFLKEISVMMPKGLKYFYWQNSGGEAVDKALKIAKAYTGTIDVVAFKNGFHGRTHGAVAVTWNEKYRKPFGLDDVDWVHFAKFNDIDDFRKVLDDTGAKIVILEMVQGEENGNCPADPDFITTLWQLVNDRGGVVIDDEVQAGFGRTATHEGDWFACMSYGVIPDIMVIGKSFGGGYPVTAVVTNKDISKAMKNGYDGSTFGGNPMAMTSALIATRQMREQDITKNAIVKGEQLRNGLEALAKKYPLIKDVRGLGLMLAFSVGNQQNVMNLQKSLKNEGVKTSLSTGAYIRLLPPTIISELEVDEFLYRLDRALESL